MGWNTTQRNFQDSAIRSAQLHVTSQTQATSRGISLSESLQPLNGDVAADSPEDDETRLDTERALLEVSVISELDQRPQPANYDNKDTDLCVEEVDSESGNRNEPQQTFWNPIWLQRISLVLFAMLFAAIAVSLLVLWRINDAQNGFRPILGRNHYAWTYAPTAILTVVVSLWRQLDYHCKMLQPWQALRNGPQDASHSVLLDYLSPIIPTTLWRAIRYRHYTVAASVLGLSALKLVILFSTGLLVLIPTAVEHKYPITITTKFSGSEYWKVGHAAGKYPGWQHDPFLLANSSYDPVYPPSDPGPVITFLGLLNGTITQPRSIAGDVAFESFQITKNANVNKVSAEVNVFAPEISCEIAETTVLPSNVLDATAIWSIEGPSIEVRSETCSVGAGHQLKLDFSSAFNDLLYETCYDKSECSGVVYDMLMVNCSNVEDSPDAVTLIDANTLYDFRYAFVVSNETYTHQVEPMDVSLDMRTIHNVAAVICKVDYGLNKANVVQMTENNSFSIGETYTHGHLSNFTGLMLGELIRSAAYAALPIVFKGNVAGDSYTTAARTLYHVMLQTLEEPQLMERFLSPDILKKAAGKSLTGIGIHFMQQSFMVEASEPAEAIGTFAEDRLQIGIASLWVMVAGCFVLLMCTLCIALAVQQDVVPDNPGKISMIATILMSSDSVRTFLRDAGKLRLSQLQAMLEGLRFRAMVDNGFSIATHRQCASTSQNTLKSKTGAWIPLTARYHMLIVTFAAPVVTIIALELLYQFSETHEGIISVSSSEDRAILGARYVSALVMLLVATCFNSLDFTISAFAPYSLLRAGNVPAIQSLNYQSLGKLPPIALWQSCARRHYASAFSSICAIVGSVLTIVASGLWSVDRTVPRSEATIATYSNYWDYSWHNSSIVGDGGASTRLDDVQHGSATMPDSIWNGTVLPQIQDVRFVSTGSGLGSTNTFSQNHTFELTALRPFLSCEVVEDDYIDIVLSQSRQFDYLEIIATPPLRNHCSYKDAAGTDRSYSFGWDTIVTPLHPTLYSTFYDLNLGPWTTDPVTTAPIQYETNETRTLPSNVPAGCPSIGVIFANTHHNKTTKDDVTALLCSQKLQKINVNVTYRGGENSTLVMNPEFEPVLDEQSATFLTNGTEGIETFPWRVSVYINLPNSNLTSFDTGGGSLPFFNHIIYGPNGTAVDDLVGRGNRDTLIKAVQRLYNKYMTLVIDMQFRKPMPLSNPDQAQVLMEQTAYGTTTTELSRLRVDAASKLALEIMLGVMTLFGLCAWWLTDLRGTLPRNPCSIASTMGFLADSDLCNGNASILHQGHRSSSSSDKEAREKFQGWVFSLGWWTVEEERNSTEENDESGEGESTVVQDSRPKQRRFGIDVGSPEQLGFRETSGWKLRRRIARALGRS